MKKTILLLVALAFFCTTAGLNAQTKDKAIGAGFVVSLPIGTFSDGASTGFGGTAVYEMAFMPQLVGTGSIGYISWGTGSSNVSFSAVPVAVGVKYFFTPGVGFYGLGQLGLTFFSWSVDIPSYSVGGFTFGGGSQSASSSEFTFAIGAGYEVPVSPKITLDFSGAFNLISDYNNIQLRAGGKYSF